MNFGNALRDKGDADGAVAAFREAVRLKPDDPEMLFNLGFSLCDKGQLAQALTYRRRGHERASKTPRRSYAARTPWPNSPRPSAKGGATCGPTSLPPRPGLKRKAGPLRKGLRQERTEPGTVHEARLTGVRR
jgi:tetratricopeptide (TPR) repeat protein